MRPNAGDAIFRIEYSLFVLVVKSNDKEMGKLKRTRIRIRTRTRTLFDVQVLASASRQWLKWDPLSISYQFYGSVDHWFDHKMEGLRVGLP